MGNSKPDNAGLRAITTRSWSADLPIEPVLLADLGSGTIRQ